MDTAKEFLSDLFTANQISLGRYGKHLGVNEIAALIKHHHDGEAMTRDLPPERKQMALEMYELYKTGKSIKEVAEAFERSSPTVWAIFHQCGYKTRARGKGGVI